MNVLFLGYWGANEGLSQSTINPHLKILCSFSWVETVVYISMERNSESHFLIPDEDKICHLPFYSKYMSLRGINKLSDFVRLPGFVRSAINDHRIDFVICRSSLAGAIGAIVHRRTGIPYAVESFEPHADYMFDAGVWSKNGVSYYLQKRFEENQKKTAKMLMPVSNLYKQKLIKEGVPEEKLCTVPCAVDLRLFEFNQTDRNQIRAKFGIDSNAMVGIYVGKFGGIYLDQEAFVLFAEFFKRIDTFYLFILTPQDASSIYEKAKSAALNLDRIKVFKVSHEEVPGFLSASDIAFSLHSPTDSKKYVSPIKNGEYWANGLLVVMPKGIGDDSSIIDENSNAGVLWKDISRPEDFDFKLLIENTKKSVRSNVVAKNYRDFDFSVKAYKQISHIFNVND